MSESCHPPSQYPPLYLSADWTPHHVHTHTYTHKYTISNWVKYHLPNNIPNRKGSQRRVVLQMPILLSLGLECIAYQHFFEFCIFFFSICSHSVLPLANLCNACLVVSPSSLPTHLHVLLAPSFTHSSLSSV